MSDFFNPTPLNIGRFEVHTFDKIPDPIKSSTVDKVIRAHHSAWGIRNSYFKEENTLISDRPEDYLNLYASAEITHSDRVHACVAALAFGKKCRLYYETRRAQLFNEVGININKIMEDVVSVDQKELTKKKKAQISFLSSVIKNE